MDSKLVLYNTLTRRKEVFEPLVPGRVGMYVCGPTVYGDPHLGHARPAVTFDLLFRYLKASGYKVRYVRNITDVGHLEHDADEGEDKIAKKARLEQLEPMEVAHYYTERYHRAMDALNVETPSIEPYASGHIIEQIEFVKRILADGYAYEANGSVYFDVRSTTPNTTTAGCRGATSTTSSPTRASWTGSRTNATPTTSRCGRRRRPSISCGGRRPGARVSRAGTWSARRCPRATSGSVSTSTAAAWT